MNVDHDEGWNALSLKVSLADADQETKNKNGFETATLLFPSFNPSNHDLLCV